jgi:hypothetical protein
MASDYSDIPRFLATREGEAYDAQFSTEDYGRVGDQRPYQIVFPSYPAPKWLGRFINLNEALRECGTLCQLTGQPFRLVKWGARLPCYPCRGRKRFNKLPGARIVSPGALDGFPDAQPVADFTPRGGTIVYGDDGQPRMVGAPNFHVTRKSCPKGFHKSFVDFDTPLPVRYLEAVKTAQYIANHTGQNAYLCSSMGAHCNVKSKRGTNTKWVPVVYVQPGGLVRRYPTDLKLQRAISTKGSTSVVNPVTADEFRELIRESAGRTRLGQGH